MSKWRQLQKNVVVISLVLFNLHIKLDKNLGHFNRPSNLTTKQLLGITFIRSACIMLYDGVREVSWCRLSTCSYNWKKEIVITYF